MENNTFLPFGLAAIAAGFLYMSRNENKEGYADVSQGIVAQPDFKAPIAPRFDANQVQQTPGNAMNPGPGLANLAAPPTPTFSYPDNYQNSPVKASSLGTQIPNFVELGNTSGSQLLKNDNMSSQQTQDILTRVGKGSPEYQDTKDLMPLLNMRGGVDPTNPKNFMYDRTLFSRLKRRYGNEVDFIRGDIDVTPEYRGWFDVRSVSDVDVVAGYFDNFIDIQQSTSIKDAVFDRRTPLSEKVAAASNPFGDVRKLPGLNIDM